MAAPATALTPPTDPATVATVKHEEHEQGDPALRAANLALSSRGSREETRFASIELRFTDAHAGPWEIAALAAVAGAAGLVVLGLWFF